MLGEAFDFKGFQPLRFGVHDRLVVYSEILPAQSFGVFARAGAMLRNSTQQKMHRCCVTFGMKTILNPMKKKIIL